MDLISVVMPVFNAERFLDDSISSVLSQSHVNFEFLIINDGSNDGSLVILKKYAELDKRIKLISRENKGLIASLNEGICLARGQWIARMDADDICLPNRFKHQLNFINANSLDMCGAWANKIGSEVGKMKLPIEHKDLVVQLLFRCPFIHPSIMCRADVIKNIKYQDRFKYAEDYQLWTEIVNRGFRVGNIPEYLLLYRAHPNQVSSLNLNDQKSISNEISKKYLVSFLGANNLSAEEFKHFIENYNNLDYLSDYGCNFFIKIYNAINYGSKSYYAQYVGKLYVDLSVKNRSVLFSYLKFSLMSKSYKLKYLIYLLITFLLTENYRLAFRKICKEIK